MNIFKRISVQKYIKEYSLKAEEYLESKGLQYFITDYNYRDDGVVYTVIFNDTDEGIIKDIVVYLGPKMLSFADSDSDIHKLFEEGYEAFKKSIEVFLYNCIKEKEHRQMMEQYKGLFITLEKELKALTNCSKLTLNYICGVLYIDYYDEELANYHFNRVDYPVDYITYDIEKIEDINAEDIISIEKERMGL